MKQYVFDFGLSEVAQQVSAQILAGSIHRSSDPGTSKDGADHVAPKLSGLRAEFVRRLSLLGEATANEVAAGSESIRKRARECERLGFIVAAGRRVCSVTKCDATIWKVR